MRCHVQGTEWAQPGWWHTSPPERRPNWEYASDEIGKRMMACVADINAIRLKCGPALGCHVSDVAMLCQELCDGARISPWCHAAQSCRMHCSRPLLYASCVLLLIPWRPNLTLALPHRLQRT